MDTDEVLRRVKQAKSVIEEVKRSLSSLTSYVDTDSRNGSYVYSQLSNLRSKLDDAETKLRKAIRELD